MRLSRLKPMALLSSARPFVTAHAEVQYEPQLAGGGEADKSCT